MRGTIDTTMRREGWIYGLAFVVILGIGAALILPRLKRLRGGPHPAGETAEAPPAPAAVEPPPSETADRPVVRVRVRGPRGGLRGPLKEVVGAEVIRTDAPAGGDAELALRVVDERVAFGASGHRWRGLPASDVVDGLVVELAEAAPSTVLRVREVDGRPAADVPVIVRPAAPSGALRTDAGGTLVLDDLADGIFVLSVGGRERHGPTLRLVAGRDRDVTAVLDPPWRVHGTVVDAGSNEPVAGVRVDGIDASGLLGRAAETDERGRFSWTGPVASTLSLRLTRPGRAVTAIEILPPGRGDLVTDVGTVAVEDPAATLEGRVLAANAGGGVEVRVEPAVAAILRELFGPTAVLDAPVTATIDDEGVFRVPDVPAGLVLRVSVRGAGLPLDDVLTVEPGVTTLPPYAPPPGHVLDARIVDAERATPRPGVRVLVSTAPTEGDVASPFDRVAVTDGAGRLRVDGLPLGRVFLRAYEPGCRPLLREIELPRATTAVLALEAARGEPERRVEGRVTDTWNEPLPGVTVRAAGRTCLTGADGTFRLDDVEGFGDEVLLTAAYEPGTAPEGVDPTGFVAGVRRAVVPGAGPVRVGLAVAAALRFRVLDGLDDEPLSFVHLLLRGEDGHVQVDRAFATRDGEVRLDGLLPVGGTLSIFSRRHRLVTNVVLRAGKETDLGTIRLARGIHITGRIVDASGEPVAGAFLGGVEPGWLAFRGGDPSASRELDLRRAVSLDDGTFELDGFDPKRPAILAVWAPGYAPAARRVVVEKFQDDVRVDVTVRLQRGGWLAVELREAETERPVTGALFDLEDARNGSDYLDLLRRGMLGGAVGSADDWRRASEHFLFEVEDGRYRLGPAEPGPYEVWVDRPGYRAIRRKLTILDPADAIVSLTEGPRALTQELYLTWEMEPGP